MMESKAYVDPEPKWMYNNFKVTSEAKTSKPTIALLEDDEWGVIESKDDL